ncbi:DUF4058 family protein [Moorena sp. SIO3A2]|uniref:DUF4058 family protein n=1 Tax=Moorena sp. SIO3A2 TaxID=2607841 RepID=UPI00338F9F5E
MPPSPFPGMDPYVEHPSAWPNVHHRLITAIADFLAPQLLPKYQVLIEERIYQTIGTDSVLVGIPDAAVKLTQTTANPTQTNPTQTNVTVASAPSQPTKVILPIPEKVRQRCSAVLGVSPMSDCIKTRTFRDTGDRHK